MATIAVLGTFDTKGVEHGFVAERIRERGHHVLLIDVGGLEQPQIEADLSREAVAREAGLDLPGLMARRDRGEMVSAFAQAATVVLGRLVLEGRVQGVISLGGGGGTAIGTAAMRALPVGFPKLMVTTLASGNTAPYVGVKDIVLFPSIVDVAGLNRVSRVLFSRAAGAICGMVESTVTASSDRPVIVASMFGNTTSCVQTGRRILEEAGYEVLVFHATGTGGRTMESLIESGMASGVFDVTTTEWADELVGGILSAGPTRCDAAAAAGVPTVLAPGCLDMVNFGTPESVPERFAGRRFYRHNPQVTLMRTSPAECAELGRILAEKANRSRGPVAMLLPLRGVSVISAQGGAFHDPAADAALFDAIRKHLRPGVELIEVDATINDPEFAEKAARALLRITGQTLR